MLRRFPLVLVYVLLGLPLKGACAAEGTPEPIPGIGPVGEIVKLHTGLQFTEGPAADGQGNVYFSDIPAHTIYKIDAAGKLSVFTDESNHSNGLMFNASGEMTACEMDGQIAVWNVASKKRRVIAPGYKGKRFNAPNDLVIDRQGGVYITDPKFRAPDPLPQGTQDVYYIDRQGKVTRVVEDLPAPNGVILSPDEKTLYVFPSLQAEMMAYPVEAPGKLGEGKVLVRLKQKEKDGNSGADGVTIDTKGNLYITSQLGLQVVTPAGKLLGIIPFPEQPANVTFGGNDRKTLYVTARTSIYTVKMEAQGHVFAPQRGDK